MRAPLYDIYITWKIIRKKHNLFLYWPYGNYSLNKLNAQQQKTIIWYQMPIATWIDPYGKASNYNSRVLCIFCFEAGCLVDNIANAWNTMLTSLVHRPSWHSPLRHKDKKKQWYIHTWTQKLSFLNTFIDTHMASVGQSSLIIMFNFRLPQLIFDVYHLCVEAFISVICMYIHMCTYIQ